MSNKQQPEPQMVMSESYKKWRGMIFLVTPGQVELTIKEPNKVFGVSKAETKGRFSPIWDVPLPRLGVRPTPD